MSILCILMYAYVYSHDSVRILSALFSTLHPMIFQIVEQCLSLLWSLPWCVRIQAATHLNHQLSDCTDARSWDGTLFFDKKSNCQ